MDACQQRNLRVISTFRTPATGTRVDNADYHQQSSHLPHSKSSRISSLLPSVLLFPLSFPLLLRNLSLRCILIFHCFITLHLFIFVLFPLSISSIPCFLRLFFGSLPFFYIFVILDLARNNYRILNTRTEYTVKSCNVNDFFLPLFLIALLVVTELWYATRNDADAQKNDGTSV